MNFLLILICNVPYLTALSLSAAVADDVLMLFSFLWLLHLLAAFFPNIEFGLDDYITTAQL